MISATPTPPSSRIPNSSKPGSGSGSAGRRIPNAAPSPASADQRFSSPAVNATPQIGGRTPQPEGQANTIDFSQAAQASGNTPKQQARMLGNLIGNQQADARMASLNENGGGRSESDSNYPPSVLDAINSNKGVPPTESIYAEEGEDDGEDTESEASRNAAFQQQQRAGADNQAHFLQSGDGYDEGMTDADDGYAYEDGTDESAYEDPEPTYQSSSVYQPTVGMAGRLSGMLQAEEIDNEEDEEAPQVQKTPGAAAATNEVYEMFQRGRRLLTASTGIGFVLALAEIDLVAINRGLFKGSIQMLPGARPEGAYEENPSLRKSDWVDMGLAFGLHVAGIIMLLGVIVQFLIFALPFIAPALGLAYAQQIFGADIANLLSSWAPSL